MQRCLNAPMKLGFYIHQENIGHVPVRFLGFDGLDAKKKPFRVEMQVTGDPWFAADALRKMADRIEQLSK